MSKLLRKPNENEVAKGVKIVQEVTSENAPLKYVEFKVIDLASGAKYAEQLGKKER